MSKKDVRRKFREFVFARDKHKCAIPNCTVMKSLDTHHITNRNDMPNGGYVKENGISLCPVHHFHAEDYLSYNIGTMTPDYLYSLIESSYVKAFDASCSL